MERDLIPLILSYCVEKGREVLEEFDLQKIQQLVVSKFLLGKPLIMQVDVAVLLPLPSSTD